MGRPVLGITGILRGMHEGVESGMLAGVENGGEKTG